MLKGDVLHNRNLKGEGKVIAVLDAGFYKVDEMDAFQKLFNEGRVLGSWDFVAQEESVFEDHSHGMMVLSTMGAENKGQIIGTSPNASFWLLRSEDGDTENLIEELIDAEPKCYNDINSIEDKYKCSISFVIEKHNPLQHTYFYEIDFELEKNFFVEIESGINNGAQLNHSEWGIDTKSNTKIVEILDDIILDEFFYEKDSFLERKAQEVLNANKSKLFEFNRQNNYDNYVTGGNSKMKLDSLLKQLHLEYIYKEEEVDCNFI